MATRRGYNEHIGPESSGPTSKFVKSIKLVAILNGIELIPVACSSLPCTLSLYNAFMWTVSVQAGQSELNVARVTNEQTKERTHHVTFFNLYMYCIVLFYITNFDVES